MAAEYDITIEQGADFSLAFLWKDSDGELVDLTGYSARMQVRRSVRSTGDPLLSLTSSGDISLGGATGRVDVAVPAAVTAAITWRTGVYDLELVSGSGAVTRILQGRVSVSPEVTR